MRFCFLGVALLVAAGCGTADDDTAGESPVSPSPSETSADADGADDDTSDADGADDDTSGDDPTQDDDDATQDVAEDDDRAEPGAPPTDDDGADDDVPLPTAAACDPLPPADGTVIELTPDDDLAAAVDAAETGTTLLLADGEYDVSGAEYIVFDVPGVTLRSRSGDPDSVVIDGGYQIGSILNVRADDVTIAEVTLQRCQWHPIHVTGGVDSDTTGTAIYRVNVIDPGQQAIKINASEGFYADEGSVACSNIVLTDAGREQVTDCYTGGIDAHLARGWRVHDNHIEGFFCSQGLSEHGVHFWNSGRDTVVERNRIVDCARGVGFGLGEGGNGTSRDYGDDACPGASFVGHYGGVIRNNMVFASSSALFSSEFGFDSGVSLEQACGTEVVHNTVYSTEEPFVSMEYRFGNTSVLIANNLTSHRILERDGASATLEGNLTEVGAEVFRDAVGGDLHLADGSAAIDQGVALTEGLVSEDYDGEPRDDAPDVGADEQ